MTQLVERPTERGSALLIVLVVMLVLSVTGLALLTKSEKTRDIAYSDMYTKEALYAAEMGLREGELVLRTLGSVAADSMLQHVSTAVTEPINPQIPVFPQHTWEYDLQHLGTYLTFGGNELVRRPVQLPSLSDDGPMPQAYYSIMIRNNMEDSSVADGDVNGVTDAREDDDRLVRIVSVGWVEFGETVYGDKVVHAVKILEEKYTWAGENLDPSAQKLTHQDGSGRG